jgi:hypothetical protein
LILDYVFASLFYYLLFAGMMIDRRVEMTARDMAMQKFYTDMANKLRVIFDGNPSSVKEKPSRIICYGLGNFLSGAVPRYQLAFLYLISEEFRLRPCQVELYDPVLDMILMIILWRLTIGTEMEWRHLRFGFGIFKVFLEHEKILLSKFLGFKVLEINEMGMKGVEEVTLFLMPHCPHFLMNNLLSANWNAASLSNLIVIGNSYHSREHPENAASVKMICDKYEYIAKLPEVGVEHFVPNTFENDRVFNDMSVTVFPFGKLGALPEEFWSDRKPPVSESSHTEGDDR